MWMRTVKYDEVIVMMLKEVYNKKLGNFNDICHEGGRGGSRVPLTFFHKYFFGRSCCNIQLKAKTLVIEFSSMT